MDTENLQGLKFLVGAKYRESTYSIRLLVLEAYAKAKVEGTEVMLTEVSKEVYVVPACVLKHVKHLIEIGMMKKLKSGRYAITDHGQEYLRCLNEFS